jgi:hypothetical protein
MSTFHITPKTQLLSRSFFSSASTSLSGLSAHLGWARLLINRPRAKVNSQKGARSNSSAACLEEDFGAFQHDTYFNPDPGFRLLTFDFLVYFQDAAS